jgi:hypothetical protein
MPVILGLIGIITAAYFIIMRARTAAELTSDLRDVASDVKAAARRFGFRRRGNQHPVESIDDPKLAIAAIATAFIALDDLPTSDTRAALDVNLRKHLRVGAEEAREIAILGHWFVENCNGATAAIPRLSKRLHTLDKGASFGTLMEIIQGTLKAADKTLSQRQGEALHDIKLAFRIS